MEIKMLGYMAAKEMVVLERRKRKQKSKVLEYITLPGDILVIYCWSAVFPKVPVGLHVLINRNGIAQTVFLTIISFGLFEGEG